MKHKKFLIGGGIVVLVLVVVYVFVSSMIRGSNDYATTGSYYEGGAYNEVDGLYAADLAAPAKPLSMKSKMGRSDKSLIAQEESVRDVAPAGSADDEQVVGERLVIKIGTLTLVVEDVPAAVEAIKQYATEKGGFVVSSNVMKSGVAPTGDVTVRIPVDVFDTGFEDVKSLGEVESQSVTGQDVTAEYVDLDSRLTNLEATEAQFLEIMRRAVKIEDVLAVQNELTDVRGEIEVIKGRMKYLRDSASMSTLTVYLSTDPSELPVIEPDDSWKPFATVKEAARNLVYSLQSIGDFIIWVVVYVPLILLYILIFWIGYRIVRWGYRKVFVEKKEKKSSK